MSNNNSSKNRVSVFLWIIFCLLLLPLYNILLIVAFLVVLLLQGILNFFNPGYTAHASGANAYIFPAVYFGAILIISYLLNRRAKKENVNIRLRIILWVATCIVGLIGLGSFRLLG
jgi:hypothetical protein